VSTSAATQTSTGSQSSVFSAGLGPDDFLTLLVAELRNQDPLDPVSQRDMIAQLAQLESLYELREVNESLGTLVEQQTSAAGAADALALLGLNVSWRDASGQLRQGKVDGIVLSGDTWLLKVGDTTLSASDVRAVSP